MASKSVRNQTAASIRIPPERIERTILLIHGQNVMLDHDLADLYGVTTKALNQAVKRNLDRFPADFMFRLTTEETAEFNRSQSVTGSQKHRDPRYPPYVFTEHGILMLSSVLRSDRAVQVNIEIMRAFVRMREMVASHERLARKLAHLEEKYDAQFREVFAVIRHLIQEEAQPKCRIGFQPPPPRPAKKK